MESAYSWASAEVYFLQFEMASAQAMYLYSTSSLLVFFRPLRFKSPRTSFPSKFFLPYLIASTMVHAISRDVGTRVARGAEPPYFSETVAMVLQLQHLCMLLYHDVYHACNVASALLDYIPFRRKYYLHCCSTVASIIQKWARF